MNTPALIDRSALARFRARAAHAPAMFLQDLAADEIHERVAMVNREFTSPAVVTHLAEFWHHMLPDARLVADADTLDLEPGGHDLVIHALCLHYSNDPIGQLIQARRALKPDGLFLATLFGGQTLWELRAVLAEAEAAVTGGLSPRVLPMAEIRDLGGLMQRGGFALPVADSQTQVVTYSDPFALLTELRAMGETNALNARRRSFTRRKVLFEAAQRYRDAFGQDDGRIPATFEIICLTGWAPAPTQPRPLRPGTATQRLADALGAEETSLNDPANPRQD